MNKSLTSAGISVVILLLCFQLNAQNITTPRPVSPQAMVSQTVGISTVTVKYSRPAVKGRDIWGKLVPYGWNVEPFGAGGEAPWRAGADENTTIEFSHDASVEGKPVPAGKYGLFFVINEDNTGEVILSKDNRAWGHYWYNPQRDQLRAPIKIRDGKFSELLTYSFVNADKYTAELVLSWEKKEFPVSIKFATDDIVMANAAEELTGNLGFDWRALSNAANYALQNKTNIEQAMTWIDRALAINKSFTTLNIKAGLLAESGKTAEAEKMKKEALALATEPELNTFGYQLLGQQKYDQAIEVLKLATERFPKSANAWDSLGEAYAMKGDKKNAITNFKKSLAMNPPENVRANSEKYLKQFGAL